MFHVQFFFISNTKLNKFHSFIFQLKLNEHKTFFYYTKTPVINILNILNGGFYPVRYDNLRLDKPFFIF